MSLGIQVETNKKEKGKNSYFQWKKDKWKKKNEKNFKFKLTNQSNDDDILPAEFHSTRSIRVQSIFLCDDP